MWHLTLQKVYFIGLDDMATDFAEDADVALALQRIHLAADVAPASRRVHFAGDADMALA